MFAILFFVTQALAGILKVEILDVGQGDSILIQSPKGKIVLIDGGTGRGNSVVDELIARNISEINLMIATHPHADHIGGLDEVLERLPVKNYLDNGQPHTTQSYQRVMKLVEDKEIGYIRGKNGRKINLDDGISLEILHPQEKGLTGTRSDLNSNSVVVRLRHGNNCMLFTGDAEEPTESALLQKGIGPCQVLKVAHHGSNHSSSNHFLNEVQPKIALISCGKDNRYGHPGDETMSRLNRIGAQIYRTDQIGTIKVISDGQQISVEGENHFTATPNKESNKSEPSSSKQPSGGISGNPDGFDLNQATQAQLESISGIGPSKAVAILEYKNAHGPFGSFSDVEKVKGIGPSTASKIEAASYITH